MSANNPYGRFFLPGPTEVPPELFEAMHRPVVGHRSREVSDLVEGMQPSLSWLFRTSRPIYLSTSSGTGWMEAAITNLTRRRVLCVVCGSFSKRFYQIAQATGRPADLLETDWGQPNMPEQLDKVLSEHPGKYDLVTLVHSESSTGVLNPIKDLAAVVNGHEDVLVVVDTVSSMGGARIETDAWGLDFVLTASQKAVAMPPGIALAAVSERALARAREVENRGFYFDLLKYEKNMERWQTPTTPAVSLFYALAVQMKKLREEGLENRWARHSAMAERTYRWVEETAASTGEQFGLFAPEGYRSPAVTAISLPERITGPEVAAGVSAQGYTVAPGYGPLRNKTFRIGHMGEHTLDALEDLLEVLDGVIRE